MGKREARENVLPLGTLQWGSGKTQGADACRVGGAVFFKNHGPVLFPSPGRKRKTRVGELGLLKAGRPERRPSLLLDSQELD